ncbi:MAG: class I SAM-dependent methyltransferase [Myxococcota bacterium]|nr:class I SAM-dependent methyltransferase [Myxococcota bacterium]
MEGYRLWSLTYDREHESAFFRLEREVFVALSSNAPIAGAIVLDIGCGTGRHWSHLLSMGPERVVGVDSSPEMLARLRSRHRDAPLHVRTHVRMEWIGGESIGVVVSNLMLTHVRDVGAELREWVRVLEPAGEIILTDLHPGGLARGTRTTFSRAGRTFAIENHLHRLSELYSLFDALRLEVLGLEERCVRGTPVVIGLRLRKLSDRP